MKRKFKLLTSVASLCLAVALMAFGVYAAAAPKVTISGTVQFTATNVFADVEVYKYVGPSAIAAGDASWTKVGDTISFTNLSNPENTAVALAVNNLNDTNLVFQYKIVVTNTFTDKATNNVYLKVTPATANASLPAGVVYEGGTAEATLNDTTSSHTYVGTYTVNPAQAGATFTIDLAGTQVQVSRAAIGA